MAFKITARTILHLGAELISSDAVALYELIKNAIDAKSKNGVDVDFFIVMLASEFAAFSMEASESNDVGGLVKSLTDKILPGAPKEFVDSFLSIIGTPADVPDLLARAHNAYKRCNFIVVSDSGHGMSYEDLENIYLTIGTTHRADIINAALKKGGETKTPYLGEKGVGRLAVMRLGKHLLVETATEDDSRMNLLEIDWREFEKAYDKPAGSIPIEPELGAAKPKGFTSGTRITISDLRASWTRNKLQEVAVNQISRMTDPFSWAEKRRFQIRLSYNGNAVEHSRIVARELLANAHAICHGQFEIDGNGPKLNITFESALYAGERSLYSFDSTDLVSMSGIGESGKFGRVTPILKALGPFSFDLYWFNRQRLRALEGVGDREVVKGLVRAWSGICLFRDGYRVIPYGDQGDDWLGLDLEALGASGYKLNTKQLIGRVQIGRMTNPKLLDQTNRQGLVDCSEKEALINLLRDIISNRWRHYLNEAGRALKAQEVVDFDPHQAASQVESLEERVRITVRAIRKKHSGDEALLQEVMDSFKEIKDAHTRAVQRIGAIEEEKERLTQLAGIGLMIEVIAHELTRATEITEVTLKDVNKMSVDPNTLSAFNVLGQQIKVIQRRLKILEPLSVPARQRRSSKNLVEILYYIYESHVAQFQRHEIITDLKPESNNIISAFIIEGHVVQILENLIANSVYWLDIERREHKEFKAKILIEILDDPPRIRFMDNGPGIPKGRAQSVFEPFFSTKPTSKSRRQGLGLFIARQNAEMLGGSLDLVNEGRIHDSRFNTLELVLKKEA